MIGNTGGLAGLTTGDLSLTRAVEILSEQRRRIAELLDRTTDAQRALRDAVSSLAWHAPSRLQFDRRLTAVQRALARAATALRAALDECDRARDHASTVASSLAPATPEKQYIGYPAGGESHVR